MTPNQRVWRLAGPIFITNITVPLLGIIDTAVLGHLSSTTPLAAVAIGATLLTFVYWALGFLRMGTTGLCAHAFGANNKHQIMSTLNKGLNVAIVMGASIHLLSFFWIPISIDLMGATQHLESTAKNYINIRLFSVYPALINFVIAGWLIGLGNAKWPLIIALSVNSVNIIGDLILVTIFDLGAEGAAIATVAADYIGLGVGAIALRSIAKSLDINLKLKLETDGWRAYLKGNTYLFIRTLILLSCITFFTAQGARLGELTLAANAILYQLVNATAFSLDAFAHATESLAGKYKGAKDELNFMIHTKITFFWSLLFAVACSTIIWLMGEQILHLFTNQQRLIEIANQYLLWVVALPILSVLSYQFDGLFIGTNNLKAMRDIMAISALIYLIVFALTRSLLNDGLWLAFCALNLSRSIGMTIAWLKLRRYWF